MKLAELIDQIPYRLAGKPKFAYLEQTVQTVSTDCFHVDGYSLYVCTRTVLVDGHDMALAAYEKGCRLFLAQRSLPLGEDAAVMVVEDTTALLAELAARCYRHPARQMIVFGITGTAGKSSVVELTASLLRRSGRAVSTVTTDGATCVKSFRPHGNIVPDGAELQRILREFAQAGTEFAILELSAYMLSQKSHLSIPFTAVLLTNVDESGEKAMRYGGAEGYKALKASLFEGGAPFWVLPANFVDMDTGACSGRCLTFGEGGDYQVENAEAVTLKSGFGTKADLIFENREKQKISIPVPGDFALENALAAAALARVAGLSVEEVAKGLSDLSPRGRLECIARWEGRYIYADTAYSAERLAKVLRILRSRTEGKLTVLLGSVGGRTRSRRRPLGKAATTYADLAYFTADDPDFEDPAVICAHMAQDADPDRYVILPDRRHAIQRAVLEMRPGDTLLLAGISGEDVQLIGGRKEPFMTKKLVEEALALL
ncbi:MAG: hypothetical protein E7585_01100 [Ruminococcaceae bacterium]|nr:hypothetical protein [Oscillospiraceae bacterium]